MAEWGRLLGVSTRLDCSARGCVAGKSRSSKDSHCGGRTRERRRWPGPHSIATGRESLHRFVLEVSPQTGFCGCTAFCGSTHRWHRLADGLFRYRRVAGGAKREGVLVLISEDYTSTSSASEVKTTLQLYANRVSEDRSGHWNRYSC